MSSDVYYQSRVSELYGGTIALMTAATIVVVLRLIARRISAASYWWDDFTIVLALVLDYGLSTCYWVQARHTGLGRHSEAYGGPVTPAQTTEFFKACFIFLALQIFYFSSSVAFKTSLILLYYRIFGVVRWFRWTLAAAWTVVLLYFVVNLLVAVFECTPVAFYWDKSIQGGTCIKQNQFYRWNGVANLLIDFMILTLSIPMIWRLNLAFRQKLSLSGIFLLGLFVCVASVVRVTTFSQVNLDDITYTILPASMWSTVEQSIGIICACLPILRPLFGKIFASSHSGSGSTAIDGKYTRHRPGPPIGLSHLSSKPTMRNSLEGSSAGFARLDEESGMDGSVTTHVTRGSNNDLRVLPQAILKNQSIEQHYDRV